VRQCDIKSNKGAKNEGKMKEKKKVLGLLRMRQNVGFDCDILGDGHWSVLRQGGAELAAAAPRSGFFGWLELGVPVVSGGVVDYLVGSAVLSRLTRVPAPNDRG